MVGARVSHVQGKQKTSHLTQASSGMKWAGEHRCEVVGTVEDLNVSAIKLGPWERKDLRQWLTDRVGEFDVLIFAKTDRIFRRAQDSFKLTEWCKEHKKVFVIVEDNILIDFYTPESEQDPMTMMAAQMFLFMAAFFADLEGKRYVQNANARNIFLRKTDRWPFGKAPFGFRIVEHPSGKGKALAHDEWAQSVIHYAARLFLSGDSLTRIVAEFNTHGVYPPMDWARAMQGEEIRGDQWSVDRLKDILLGDATQGIKTSKGKRLLNEEGEPIQVGPPSFDSETWKQIHLEWDKRSVNPRGKTRSVNPLLGVCKCGVCGGNTRQDIHKKPSGKTYRYYRCAKTPVPCPGVSIIAEQAEEIVEISFLESHAERRVKKRVWREGSDSSQELEQTNFTIESLREDRAMGFYTTDEDIALFRSQMKALIAKRDELSAQPIVKAGWMNVETEKTYAEVWEAATPDEKRTMLVDANVRLVILEPNHWTIHTDTDAVLGEGEAPEEVFERLTRTETL